MLLCHFHCVPTDDFGLISGVLLSAVTVCVIKHGEPDARAVLGLRRACWEEQSKCPRAPELCRTMQSPPCSVENKDIAHL